MEEKEILVVKAESMTKSFKIKFSVISAVTALLAAVIGFCSVSYAKWTDRNAVSLSATASTGVWSVYDYAVVTESGGVFSLSMTDEAFYGGTFYIDGDTKLCVFYDTEPLRCELTLQTDPAAEKTDDSTYKTLKGKGFYKVVTDGRQLTVSFLFGKDFASLTDSEMKEILVANGLGKRGAEQGAITSTGQVVGFDKPFTLQEGEQLVIFGAGEKAAAGTQLGKYGISESQSSDGVSINNSMITANTAGEYEIKIVKGNVTGDQGLVNIYSWIAVKDTPDP